MLSANGTPSRIFTGISIPKQLQALSRPAAAFDTDLMFAVIEPPFGAALDFDCPAARLCSWEQSPKRLVHGPSSRSRRVNRFNDEELTGAVLQQVEENLRRLFPLPDKAVSQKMEELLRQLAEAVEQR